MDGCAPGLSPYCGSQFSSLLHLQGIGGRQGKAAGVLGSDSLSSPCHGLLDR